MTLLTIMLTSLNLYAAQPLPHFQPGNYKLKQGLASECGQGAFKLMEANTKVMLGPLHIYDMAPATGRLVSDAPGEEGCIYDYKFENHSQVDASQLTFSETATCKGALKHTLTEVTEIRDGKVSLSVNQTGDPSYQYTCAWELAPPTRKK